MGVGAEVAEELLGKGAIAAEEGGGVRAEHLENVVWRVVSLLVGGIVEDGLGSRVIADSSANLIQFEEGAEAGKVALVDHRGKGVQVSYYGQRAAAGVGVKTYVVGWVEPKVEVKAGVPERNEKSP